MPTTAAIAMENVNVWRLLVGMALARLDLVVLGMAAARGDELVLFKIALVVFRGDVPLGEVGHLHARTGWNLRLRQHIASLEWRMACGPAADCGLLSRRLSVADGDYCEGMGLQG
jgi:hypothetical protein